MTLIKEDAYIWNDLQLQKHTLPFILKKYSPFSASSNLSPSTMAYNTTASTNKLSFTDNLDFGKSQARFWQDFWSKNDSSYLDVKLERFKRDDNRELRMVQNLTMGEADFNQFIRLRNQLVIAAENFATDENLFPVFLSTMFKDMDQHLKLGHNLFDVVDGANKTICETILWYSVDKPESSYAQVRIFARKEEDKKFQQIV